MLRIINYTNPYSTRSPASKGGSQDATNNGWCLKETFDNGRKRESSYTGSGSPTPLPTPTRDTRQSEG